MRSHTFTMSLLLTLICSIAAAQFSEKSEQNPGSTRPSMQSLTSQSLPNRIVLDGPVDPKEFVIGPGDIFAVNIWAAMPLMFQVPVTPEGTIVIPTVAEVAVSGLTLEEARAKALTEIKKKYITATASFTLQTPRSFMVTVMGEVLSEGPTVIQSTQRVDRVLQQANDISAYQERMGGTVREQTALINKKIASSSVRNIQIRRRNGSTVNADIERYRATGNSLYNPLLMDGDVLIVRPRDLARDFVGIYGAVTKPGAYEFVDGDSISMLLRLAAGVTPLADLDHAVLFRTTGKNIQSQERFNVHEVLSGNADRPLMRGDRIMIPAQNILSNSGTVTIEGEVVQPGVYPIIRDSTTLSQIIAMAGGFTRYASMNGSKIVRDTKDDDKEDIDFQMLRRGLSTTEDTVYLSNEMQMKMSRAVSSVDFTGLFVMGDASRDVVLYDGDKIIVPQRLNAVYVFGEVKKPGYVAFGKDRSADGYISMAGGLTESAVDDDIRIIKASSKQWLTPGETTIEEGDYVWVPKQPYRSFGYQLGIYSQFFSIIATTVSLIILVTN